MQDGTCAICVLRMAEISIAGRYLGVVILHDITEMKCVLAILFPAHTTMFEAIQLPIAQLKICILCWKERVLMLTYIG